MTRLSIRGKRSLTVAVLAVCLLFAHTTEALSQHQQQQQQQQQQQEHQLLQQRSYEVIQYQQNTAARLQRQLQTHAHRPPFLLNRHSKRHSARPERHKCTSKHCKHSTHGKHRIHKEKSPCAKEHRNSFKEAQRRSFLKSTFHKNGRMYMLAHQDWYTQYRRQRGPGGVMRKLTLENARRRKAMITLLPSSYFGINNRLSSGSGGGGNNNKPSLSDGYDSVGDGSGSNAKDIGAEGDTGGEGKEADDDDDDIDLAGAKEDFPDRATETIQAVKRPTFMGIAEPVSYQHRGLIPKARSLGSRLSPWLLQLAISTAFTPLLLTYM